MHPAPSSSSSRFFASYPDFDHDATASLTSEFQRLSLQRGWKAGGRTYHKHRQRCFEQEFEYHYGGGYAGGNRLGGWQRLCRDVYIEPVPASITQCRKALSLVAVNLVDLIDARRMKKKVKLFPNKAALRDYSLSQGKIFPKKKAKADGFLSALLIEIF